MGAGNNPYGPGGAAGGFGGYGNFMGPPYYGNGGPGGGYGMPPMQMAPYWGGGGPAYGQYPMGGPHHGPMHQYPMVGGGGVGGSYQAYHPQELSGYPPGGMDPYYGQMPPLSNGEGQSTVQKQSQRSSETNAKATSMGVLTGRPPVLLYMSCDDDSLSGKYRIECLL